MERRFYLGMGILIFFLALALVVSFSMVGAHTPTAQKLENAAQFALLGALDEGVHLANQAQARWYKYRTSIAAVADQTPMDEIDNLFAELNVFAQAENNEHFAACCAQLSRAILAVIDAHGPAWENIL